jgi:hypothetical protein
VTPDTTGSATVDGVSNNPDVPDWLRRVAEEADAAFRPLMPAIRAAAHFDGARDVVAAVDAGMTELAAALRPPTPDQAVVCQGGIVLPAISMSGTGTITAVATVTSPPPPALSRQAFLTLLAILAGFALLAARTQLSAEAQNAINYCCAVIGLVLTVIAVILKR